MSQVPPPPAAVPHYQPGLPAEPRKTSGAAVASLIFGVLGCLIVTGILAVIFGIVGIRKTRDPRYGGRGLAVAGIILGLVTMLPTLIAVGTGGLAYWLTTAPREAGREWVQAVAANDLDAAVALSTPDLPQWQLESAAETLRVENLGAFRDMKSSSISTVNDRCEMNGKATFERGTVDYRLVLRKRDGQWKVESFSLQPTGQ